MADLTLRLTKGSALTLQELDSNFQALDSDVANLSSSLASSYVTLGTTQTISGAKTFSADTIFSSTGAIKVPSGADGDRPSASNGQLRYNTTQGAFEGYASGAWSSLGGVKDVDGDTKIIAELSPGGDSDRLRFYTGGTERMSVRLNGIFLDDSVTVLGLYKLPTADGTAGQYLKTNANGTTVFDSVPPGYNDTQADARIAAASIFDLSDVSSGVVVTNLNADLLDGVSIASLLRSDATDAYTSGTLTFNSGTTFTAASGATVNFSNTTGTAPFTVASTTKVSNLNADQVDGFNGIGIYDSAGTLLNGA